MQSNNYGVVLKGQYAHKQTNEFLKISRYLIIRKKHSRYLALELENLKSERLDSLTLQIDQYDARGNYLGTYDYSFDKLSVPHGVSVLKQKILLNTYCADFFVKITSAKYGKFVYRLGDDGEYSVFDNSKPPVKVNEGTLDKAVVKNGRVSNARKFSAPAILGVFFVLCIAAFMVLATIHIMRFKKEETSFILNSVEYEFVDPDKTEGTDLIVKGYVGYGNGNVIITEELEGYKVKKISKDAFARDKNIRTLRIDGNVTLDSYAFSSCENLTKVVLNGVKSISSSCFYNCSSLTDVEIYNAEQVGASSFANCSKLNNLYISSKSLDLNIGDRAFARCGNLTNITIDQFIKYGPSIGYFYNSGSKNGVSLKLKNFNYALYETDGLVNNSLNDLFGTSVALTDIEIGNISVISKDFCNSISDSLTSFKVDNLEVKEIGDGAFANCSKLSEIHIPSVTKVGEEAFKNTAITSFDTSNLEAIGKSAFYNCTQLSQFNIKDNTKLTELQDYAFALCKALKSFYVPKKVNVIGNNCFEGSGLETVEFNHENALSVLNAGVFKDCISLKAIVLPTSVVSINDYAFYNCSALDTINLPANVAVLGEGAFKNCSSLSSFKIPVGVTELRNSVFTGCSALTSITFNAGLTKIGAEAFRGTALPSCVIPDSVTEIGSNVFKDVNTLTALTVPFIGEALTNTKNLGYFFDAGTSYNNQYLVVPASLAKIVITRATVVANGTFTGLANLSDITLSDQTIDIGYEAFAGCTGLRYIILPENLNFIAYNAFANCYKLYEIENRSEIIITRGDSIAEFALAVYGKNPKKIPSADISGYVLRQAADGWYLTDVPTDSTLTLPTAVKNSKYILPSYLFYGLNTNAVTLTKGVKQINDNCFSGANSLTSITTNSATFDFTAAAFSGLSNTLSSVDFSGLSTTVLPANIFAGYGKLSKVVLPNSLEVIGAEAFKDCSSLTDVNFPSNLKTIGDYAFNRTNLSIVSLPDNVESIGNYAFSENYSLTEVSLSKKLETLGDFAFNNCTLLAVVTLPYGLSTSAYVSDSAFNGCESIYEIFDLRAYKITFGDESFGAVARNAVVIHKNLSEERLKKHSQKDAEYRYNDEVCALVKFNGGDEFEAEKVTIGNKKRIIIINRNAFSDYLQKVTITDAVKEIRGEAFVGDINLLVFSGSAIDIKVNAFANVTNLIIDGKVKSISENAFTFVRSVYYNGTEKEWKASSYKDAIANKYAAQYFYSECIHEDGLKLWNYDVNGMPNTLSTPYNHSKVEPDCEHDGEERYYCDKCGYDDVRKIPKLGHDYVDNICTRCGKINPTDVTKSTYLELSKNILTFSNDSKNAFDMFEYTNGAILAPVLKSGESAMLTITAKTNVHLSFDCRLNVTGIGELTVMYNGGTATNSTTSSKSFEFDLTKGDVITVVFTKGKSTSNKNGAIIDSIKVS